MTESQEETVAELPSSEQASTEAPSNGLDAVEGRLQIGRTDNHQRNILPLPELDSNLRLPGIQDDLASTVVWFAASARVGLTPSGGDRMPEHSLPSELPLTGWIAPTCGWRT
jgi:hypothetical protein